jgi:hypothetical protein
MARAARRYDLYLPLTDNEGRLYLDQVIIMTALDFRR